MKKTRLFVPLAALIAVLATGRWAQRPTDQVAPKTPVPRVTSTTEFVRLATTLAKKGNAQPEISTLVESRRAHMLALMEHEPAAALRNALSWSEWASLPESIQARVERPVSFRGDWSVVADCAQGGAFAEATISAEGQTWRTTPHGRWASLGTKRTLPVQGIVLGARAALAEERLTRLTAADARAAAGVIGKPLPAVEGVTALIGGEWRTYADETALAKAEVAWQRELERPGPEIAALPSDGSSGGSSGTTPATTPPSWTQGIRKVICVVVDFPDATGADITPAAIADVVNKSVSVNFERMSYHQLALQADAVPDVIRLPQPTTFYKSSTMLRLHDDAIAAATAAGHDLSAYPLRAVYYKNYGFTSNGVSTYRGLGEVGGGRLWLQGEASPHLLTHELCHNLGVNHSSAWKPSGPDPVGAGSSVEYGDLFDVVGGGIMPDGHVHMQVKRRYNWLDDASVTTVTGSGVYRVTRFDDEDAAGVRALRIEKSANESYWVGYRRRFDGYPAFERGAYLLWQMPNQNRCWLVDTKPETADVTDAPIPLGRTYTDTAAKVSITPVAQGGSGACAWLDVRVMLGDFPGNRAPVISALAAPAGIVANAPATFSATASDPDGDALHYHWDFGDGEVSANQPTIPKLFRAPGTYSLKLTVSDGKGQTATRTASIAVAAGSAITWTDRASGTTEALRGVATNGSVAIAAGSAGKILRSTDGTTWTTVPYDRFSYFNNVIWTGDRFVAVGMVLDLTAGKFIGVLVTSPDGSTWTERWRGGGELWCVAAHAGTYLAAGRNGTLVRSTNGTTWSVLTPPAVRFYRGLAWDQGNFLLTGLSATTFRGEPVFFASPDGLTWTDLSPRLPFGSAYHFSSLAVVNDAVLATGDYTPLHVTRDGGQSWHVPAQNTENYVPALAHGAGRWLAAGTYFDYTGGSGTRTIDLWSMDGERWIPEVLPVGTSLPVRHAAVFFKGTFITVGDAGSIRQTNSLVAPPNQPPVFRGLSVETPKNTSVLVPWEQLASVLTDAEDDRLDLSASPITARGGTVLPVANGFLYTPPADFAGRDSAVLTARDKGDIQSTGSLTFTVTDPVVTDPGTPSGTTQNNLAISATPTSVDLVFAGIPNVTYAIQRSTDLETWATIGTATVGRTGRLTFTDGAPLAGPVFYRTVLP